jgi:hypothetical protein
MVAAPDSSLFLPYPLLSLSAQLAYSPQLVGPNKWRGLRKALAEVYVADQVAQYIRDLLVASRAHGMVAFGPSPMV